MAAAHPVARLHGSRAGGPEVWLQGKASEYLAPLAWGLVESSMYRIYFLCICAVEFRGCPTKPAPQRLAHHISTCCFLNEPSILCPWAFLPSLLFPAIFIHCMGHTQWSSGAQGHSQRNVEGSMHYPRPCMGKVSALPLDPQPSPLFKCYLLFQIWL